MKENIKRSLKKAYKYLSSFDYSSIGMDYKETVYPFRINYPSSENLGRTIIITVMLDAFQSIENSCVFSVRNQITDLTKFLMARKRSDGLWAFDDFEYSIDADTTLVVAISLLKSGIKKEFFKSSQHTILREFKIGDAFRTFRYCSHDHSNFGVHVELTSNALYFLRLMKENNAQGLRNIREWLINRQHKDGFWESYWYQSKYLGNFRAIRALGCSGSAAKKTLKFLESSQNTDYGWGYPESTAFDTAYALQTLLFYYKESPEFDKGLEYLLATQNIDGSWDGTTIFYFYYPQFPGKSGAEEWNDRKKKLISTSLVIKCLSNYISGIAD